MSSASQRSAFSESASSATTASNAVFRRPQGKQRVAWVEQRRCVDGELVGALAKVGPIAARVIGSREERRKADPLPEARRLGAVTQRRREHPEGVRDANGQEAVEVRECDFPRQPLDGALGGRAVGAQMGYHGLERSPASAQCRVRS